MYCLQMLKLFGVRRIYYSTEPTDANSKILNYKMEKVNQMVSSHVSFAFQRSNIQLNNIRQTKKKYNTKTNTKKGRKTNTQKPKK